MAQEPIKSQTFQSTSRAAVVCRNYQAALLLWWSLRIDAWITPDTQEKIHHVAKRFSAEAKRIFGIVLAGFSISAILWFLGMVDPVHWRDARIEFFNTLTITERSLIFLGIFLGVVALGCSFCRFLGDIRDLFLVRAVEYAQHAVLVGAGALTFFDLNLTLSGTPVFDVKTFSIYVGTGVLLALLRSIIRFMRKSFDGQVFPPLVLATIVFPLAYISYPWLSETVSSITKSNDEALAKVATHVTHPGR